MVGEGGIGNRRQVRPRSSSSGSRSGIPTALKWLTKGQYQYVPIDATGSTFTDGTEFQESGISTALKASGQDKVFPWVRIRLWYQSAASNLAFDWAVVKQLTTDALPDLDSSAVIEVLKKDGVLFAWDTMFQPKNAAGVPRRLQVEFRNVFLRDGQEIRLVIAPRATSAADVNTWGKLEYTEQVA